jgi:hypothetical protein
VTQEVRRGIEAALGPRADNPAPAMKRVRPTLSLNLTGCTALRSLPPGLTVSFLRLDNCRQLASLPADLVCGCLEFRNGPIHSLPAGLRIEHKIDLSSCVRLERLPEGIDAQDLILRGCLSLTELPTSMEVQNLDVSGCVMLSGWPGPTTLRLQRLNVTNCARLQSLPDGLRIEDSLELADSGIMQLPPSLANARLTWRGVTVNEKIAFHPQTLTKEEILTERNAEVRRIMTERAGYDRLFDGRESTVVDIDHDAGGERILRRVPMLGDEDLTCLTVRCPSTGREYVLRVPPAMQTCRQAAAWIAGYDNPDDYHPLLET